MSDAPGTKFYYNSGNPYVLSALLTRKTGQNTFDFAKKELFGPLGITRAGWGRVDAQGVIDGGAGLSLAPHDMPLPPDVVGESLLEASVHEAATERPSAVGKTPELAKQISGKPFQFSANALKVKTFA